jgi:uncharacterized protein YbgA (DUF1722 family)/uncharacterized protein YbbK (DUF523 family)
MDYGNETVTIGISSCLLGNEVRYNGQHKLNRYMRDILGQFVNYEAVCPEAECGLSIPRESMHLEGTRDEPRLVGSKTKTDYTEQMNNWIGPRLDQLEKMDLYGFIFKSKSPSSGLYNINIFNGDSIYYKNSGLFASAFVKRFPLIPVEEDGRLNDPGLRENFIQKVFIYYRFKQILKDKISAGSLVNFHTDHKLLIMSHDPDRIYDLGKIVAAPDKKNLQKTFEEYLLLLMDIIAKPATVKKHTNVLQHILGYFKKVLPSEERHELLDLIKRYQERQLPLIVPVTLINHFVNKYKIEYLQRQFYLHPHPTELMLRNHV